MDDITPATCRMTYAELGYARGISAKSAERLAQRRRWPRQVGNDGFARVLVPIGEDRVTPRRRGPTSPPDIAERQEPSGADITPDIGGVIREAIREVVAPLSAQLEHARERADRLHGELVEARAAERKAIDLVRYATAEASDQRKRADDAVDAERIARDEAAGLRAELDARQQWGLGRRIRWALGRKR
jgi:hypothetical protein